MARQQEEKGDITAKASTNVQRNSIFGRYSEVEMIARLKGLALDHCQPRHEIQPLCNQILKLRKVMILKDYEIPWRKRKLEKFMKDKLRAPSFVLPEQKKKTKLKRSPLSHASSGSCLLNSVNSTQCHREKIMLDSRTSGSLLTFDDALPEKQVFAERFCFFPNDVVNQNCPGKDRSSVVDSDESVSGSNQQSSENPPPKRRHLQPRRSIKLPKHIGDRPSKVIPVGTRFQADVPELSGPADRSIIVSTYSNDPDIYKWLGTRVWLITAIGSMKIAGRTIGKGRPNSCSCITPGSVTCIRRHIQEKRLLLQCDLGPAFFSWKFDDMGEDVLKSWSLKEQQTFGSLVKVKTTPNGKSFVKRALKSFSTKCREDIVSYYFNVYTLNRISLQTRSVPIEEVDTDDEDEAEDHNYLGSQKKSEGSAKARFLRRGSQ